MADDVNISFDISFLPDELAISLKNEECSLAPSISQYWVYNKVDLSLGSNQLIPTSTSMFSKVDGGATNPVVDANDVVRFLYIKNRDTSDVYVNLDGATSLQSDSIIIRQGQSWFAQLNDTPYDDVIAYVASDDILITYAAIVKKVA
tara:strand:- start:910 stop:1350 length:441 start_codon:yes stop_codon:yes gene_type:complete